MEIIATPVSHKTINGVYDAAGVFQKLLNTKEPDQVYTDFTSDKVDKSQLGLAKGYLQVRCM